MGKTSKEMKDREKRISMPRHQIRSKWDCPHEDKRAKKTRKDSRYYSDLMDDEEDDERPSIEDLYNEEMEMLEYYINKPIEEE